MAGKQVLYKVDINLGDAVNKLAELEVQLQDISDGIKEKTKELTEAQQEVAEKTAQGITVTEDERQHIADLRKELVILKEQRKAVSKEIGEQSRQVQNAIVQDGKYAGTLKGLCAQLSIAKDELRTMSLTDPKFAEKAAEVGKLNDKVKEMEAAYGVFTRNVGNYGQVSAQTKERIQELVKELAELAAAQKQTTPEFQAAQAQLDQYSNSLADQGSKSITMYSSAVGTLIAGLGIMQRTMGSDSEEAKKTAQIIQKLQIATVGLAAITKIYNDLQKRGIIQKIASNIQVKLATAALKAEAKAQVATTTATKGATIAQKLLNAAMNANPVILLISGIIALGAALVGLFSWLNSTSDAQKKATKAQEDYEKAARKTELTLTDLNARELALTVGIQKKYNAELRAAMQRNATKEQIAKIEAARDEELLNLQLEFIRKRAEAEKKDFKAALANYEAQKAALNDLVRRKGADAKASKEQAEAAAEAYKTYIEALNKYNKSAQAESDTLTQIATNAYNTRQQNADKAYSRAEKSLQARQKLIKTYYQRFAAYDYNYMLTVDENSELQFQHQLEYNRATFERQQKHEKQMLNLQLKHHKITKEEYEAARKQLLVERQNYDLAELDEVEKHQKALLDAAVSLAGGKSLEDQLADMRAKYQTAAKAIKDDATLTAEQQAFYLRNLADREAAEERSIRLSAQQKTDKEIEDRVKAAYDNDLRQFSSNEEDKLAYEIDVLHDIINARKTAGLTTFKEEQQLLSLEAKARERSLAKELQLEWKNDREKYLTQKEFIEKELALETLSAEQRAALEQELAELTIEENQRRLESFQNYADGVMDIATEINNLLSGLDEGRTTKAEQENAKQKKDLEKRLQAGLISQKQYDKAVAAADEELAAKKAKIAREQAIREKALSAMQIAVNTAAAIMKIWAEVPKADFGVSTGILTALAATTGALQLAAVLAQPLPTARKGGRIEGPTHEQGGVLVNTEGDERIISANPSRAFPELLNLISYIGKHSGVPETGYASRFFEGAGAGTQVATIDYDLLADKVGERFERAVAGINIYTSIEDIRKSDEEYQKIINSAKI